MHTFYYGEEQKSRNVCLTFYKNVGCLNTSPSNQSGYDELVYKLKQKIEIKHRGEYA